MEKVHSLYRSSNIVRLIKSRRLRLAGDVARMEEGKECFQHFNRYTCRIKHLRRRSRRREDNIRIGLREIGMNSRDWVYSIEDMDCWRALVNAALNLRGSINKGVSI